MKTEYLVYIYGSIMMKKLCQDLGDPDHATHTCRILTELAEITE